MRAARESDASSSSSPLSAANGKSSVERTTRRSKKADANLNLNGVENGRGKAPAKDGNRSKKRRVGVLALQDGALDVGDDGRAVVWLDIDNTLYSKKTDIARQMSTRIRNYIIGLGMGEEEADRLHRKYYKEYGLAIRGLVMHHKIDALEYDAKCDATLPLEELLHPDQRVKEMLGKLNRSKCRVWALTNAYKTHALRVLKLLELDQFIEGVIYCDYGQEKFACKPEVEFYDAALEIVGLKDPSRCYFVDDSSLNIQAAKKLGWGKCVLFNEIDVQKTPKSNGAVSHEQLSFNFSVLRPLENGNSSFEKDAIQSEFRKLAQTQRVELLEIILEACLPGDLNMMSKTLEKHLRLTKDLISHLPEEVLLRIFEKLPLTDLLICQAVSKRWNSITTNSSLWKSHALALTEGDPVALLSPLDPSGWINIVKGLHHRERNWSQGISQTLTFMRGHTGFVTAMKLRGRKTLVTGSYDETIRVWDLLTGDCKKVLTAKAISCLDFLDEEGILAAGLYDSGRVMIWNMKTWSLLQTLSGHNRGIRHVSINNDYLVSVGQDKAIVVWDWKNGTKLVRFGQQSNVSLGVSFADKDKIVAVTVDGIIRTFCIRKREMIGQYDLTKMSPTLSSLLSGLKDGSVMMQWFVAHRNTLTLASQSLVVHLKWQEHIVPDVSYEGANRSRSDSISSIASTGSNMTGRGSQRGRVSSTTTTPAKVKPAIAQNSSTTISTSRSSTSNLNRLMTPSRFQTPSKTSPKHSPVALSPVPWPKPPRSSVPRSSLTPSNSSSIDFPSPSPSPARSPRNVELSLPPASPLSTSPSRGSFVNFETATRIAPNLNTSPIVTDIVYTPDAAVGCIDPAKKRIILSSRFSSRAGADRRLYTSTLQSTNEEIDSINKVQVNTNEIVVPIGGVWQAKADELATPSRNPMSIVIDHENCIVGTNDGLVYRLGFVGLEYKQGWEKSGESSEEALLNDLKRMAEENRVDGLEGDDNVVITDLLQLQGVWRELFL